MTQAAATAPTAALINSHLHYLILSIGTNTQNAASLQTKTITTPKITL
jgi:hypothetical protein